jgi:hypothetical protein
MEHNLEYVLNKLDWMRAEGIWPNGLRYLWTDAFGLALYVSLFRETGEQRWLDQAKWLVGEVDRVLGRPHGYRIGEAADRDGQYFHYLAMWLFALACLGEHDPDYRDKGIQLPRTSTDRSCFPAAVLSGRWKKTCPRPTPATASERWTRSTAMSPTVC